MIVTIESFGSKSGECYDEVFITNKNHHTVSFSNLGARINRWMIKNKDNDYENIILGVETAEQAFKLRDYYFGVTVGPVAGRISEASYELDGMVYQLEKNDGENHLHGGAGYDLRKWDYEIIEYDNKVEVQFSLIDDHLIKGYPGKKEIVVKHVFDNENQWTIEYSANSDKKTPFNLTNHVYFNLNGKLNKNILNHQLQGNISFLVELDNNSIPTGNLIDLKETSIDFNSMKSLFEIVSSSNEQIISQAGLDHPFVFSDVKKGNLKLISEESNRKLLINSSENAVVLYTHNKVGQPGDVWKYPIIKHMGIAIETQEIPNLINQSNKKSIILYPNESYESVTTYQLKEIS